MELFLVVGLGNPGGQYAHSRHNAGFDVVEILAQMTNTRLSRIRGHAVVGEGKHEGRRLILAKPQTYMNRSGESVAALLAYYKPEPANIVLVYDDVDLPEGCVRVRAGGSAGTHNGMRSVIERLGRTDFPRVRVGVGRPPEKWELADWVLAGYATEAERKTAFESYMKAARAVLTLITEGAEASMRDTN